MNQGFDRTIINTRERPLSSDINQALSQVDRTLREVLRALFIPHAELMGAVGNSGFTPVSGFLGDALYPVAAGGMAINLTPGLGMLFDAGAAIGNVDAVAGLYDYSPYYPVYLPEVLQVTVPAAPPSGYERWDIVEVKLDRRRQDSASRDVLNPATGVFEPTSLLKTLSYSLDSARLSTDGSTGINYKVGSQAIINSSLVPTTTAGYTRVAIIYVGPGVTSITQNKIQDRRRLLSPNGAAAFGCDFIHTSGSPDTIDASALTAAGPAGMRVCVIPSGSSFAYLRVLIFAGEVCDCSLSGGTWTPGTVHASVHPQVRARATGGSPANNLLSIVGLTTYVALNSTDQGKIAAQAAVAIGQPYMEFTVSHRVIESTDTPPTSARVTVGGTLRLA